jgi:hypothetical protein
MLAGDEKDLPESLVGEMLRFGDNFIDVKRDAQDGIVTRETAIPTIVDAFVRKIEWGEEAHRSSKVLQREGTRNLRHRFELPIRFGGNQLLEPPNQLRFVQGQIVQGFDK